jgi:hypothetical protein
MVRYDNVQVKGVEESLEAVLEADEKSTKRKEVSIHSLISNYQ